MRCPDSNTKTCAAQTSPGFSHGSITAPRGREGRKITNNAVGQLILDAIGFQVPKVPRLQHKLKQNSCCSPLLLELYPNMANSIKPMNSRCKSYPDCSKCDRVPAKLEDDRILCSGRRRRERNAETIHNFSKQNWIPGAEGAQIATILDGTRVYTAQT